PARMDVVMEIARQNNLYVIEDAAESLGSTYKGRYTGTFGDLGVFSFNGNKVITTGGGGMVVTDNDELAQRARLLVNQGRADSEKEYIHQEIGYNFRLTNIQAALGLAQMKRLPEFLAVKRRNASIYRRELQNVTGIRMQKELNEAESSWWLFSIVVEDEFDEERDSIMSRLTAKGVQVRPFFTPLDQQPCYSKYNIPNSKVADHLYSGGINLPSASFLTEQDVLDVCRELLER